MAVNIFVNLPVKDLKKTMSFFSKLGFTFNKQFTDDNAACMFINGEAYVMLLSEPFFQGFTPKEIADTRKTTEVLVALSVESRERVDELMLLVISEGGSEARPPQDHGFMYGRSFNDLDGHIWELIWMDESHIVK